MIGPGQLKLLGAVLAASLFAATPARAEFVVSELIVELQPGKHIRDDIEVWNNSPDRSFRSRSSLERSSTRRSPRKRARQDPDPEKLGILVSPARMILEPGQRKLVRIATLGASAERERVYRVTIKPAAGALQSSESGSRSSSAMTSWSWCGPNMWWLMSHRCATATL